LKLSNEQSDVKELRSSNLSENIKPSTNVPLAEAMRPIDLDSYCGQDASVGPGTQLRTLIESEHIPSLILWGPPGGTSE
jgi:putative ATPase